MDDPVPPGGFCEIERPVCRGISFHRRATLARFGKSRTHCYGERHVWEERRLDRSSRVLDDVEGITIRLLAHQGRKLLSASVVIDYRSSANMREDAMDPITVTETTDTVQIAADLISAYVANNAVRAGDLPVLIADIHAALAGLSVPPAAPEAAAEQATAAQIRKSITPAALISFLDGKPYKTLKRHLATHGFSMESYRARFGLPDTYPSVAANYSAARSALARELGLGQLRREAPPPAAAPVDAIAEAPPVSVPTEAPPVPPVPAAPIEAIAASAEVPPAPAPVPRKGRPRKTAPAAA